MTLVDRSLRRQLTAAMALAMALALLLSGAAFAQTSGNEVEAVPIDDSCNDVPEDGFTDVPETDTFDDEIECLKAYGFTEGTGDGTTYEPAGFTRRWQMVQFVARLAADAAEQVEAFDLPEASDQGFNDIGDLEQRFQDNINIMAEIGVVEGKNATTFDPFENVKRDQMASFINRLQGAIQDSLGGDADGFESNENFFPDVPDSNVHRANINGLASVGIVQGKVSGDYDPHLPVTRGQMSAFIMRHYEVNVDNGVFTSKFPEGTTVEGQVGEVLEANTGSNFYRFLDSETDEDTRVDYFDNENFFVDGVEATVAFFESQITAGDTINYIDGGDEASTHRLTNNTIADGYIGAYDTAGDTITVINVVTGDTIATLDYTGDPVTVDGAAATEATFENALNEGDTIEVDDLDGDDETFNLVNGTLSGEVVDATTTSVDVELATGAVIADLDETGGDSYTVDGDPVLQPAFTAELSLGDSITLASVNDAGAREESWTLVNMAPDTETGLGADDLDAVGDTFTLVGEDGPLVVDYTVADAEALDQDAFFFVDGLAATEAEFEAEYTGGDAISFQAASDAGDGQDQVLALINTNLAGIPDNLTAAADTFDVLGPDDATSLETIIYDLDAAGGDDDELYVNGALVPEADAEATLEAAITAIEADLLDGTVEIVPADGGDPRQIRISTE
jgi:hypothetical protein